MGLCILLGFVVVVVVVIVIVVGDGCFYCFVYLFIF